jgi:hypothetical protein
MINTNTRQDGKCGIKLKLSKLNCIIFNWRLVTLHDYYNQWMSFNIRFNTVVWENFAHICFFLVFARQSFKVNLFLKIPKTSKLKKILLRFKNVMLSIPVILLSREVIYNIYFKKCCQVNKFKMAPKSKMAAKTFFLMTEKSKWCFFLI